MAQKLLSCPTFLLIIVHQTDSFLTSKNGFYYWGEIFKGGGEDFKV